MLAIRVDLAKDFLLCKTQIGRRPLAILQCFLIIWKVQAHQCILSSHRFDHLSSYNTSWYDRAYL